MSRSASSAVNSPSHYRRDGIEVADVVDAFALGPWEAQAVQYLLRADFKDGGARGGEDRAKGLACMIRALMTREPARLESFEAFGFRLVRIEAAAQPPAPERDALAAVADLAEATLRRRVGRPSAGVSEASLLAAATVADVAAHDAWSPPALCSALSDFSVDRPVRPQDSLAVALEFVPPDHPFAQRIRACAAEIFDERHSGTEIAR